MKNESEDRIAVSSLNGRDKRSKRRTGRVFALIGVILLLLVFVLLTVNSLLVMFKDDYYTTFGNYRLFAIVTDSMESEISSGSMIVCKTPSDPSEIKADSVSGAHDGTVITFKYVSGGKTVLITHRVVGITTNADGETVYVTRGDNAAGNDAGTRKFDDIVGIYTGKKCGFFGSLFGFFQSAQGVSMLIFIVFIIATAWMMIWYVNGAEAKKQLTVAALKKGRRIMTDVNVKYEEDNDIAIVTDLLNIVTAEPKTHKEEQNITERLQAFIAGYNTVKSQTSAPDAAPLAEQQDQSVGAIDLAGSDTSTALAQNENDGVEQKADIEVDNQVAATATETESVAADTELIENNGSTEAGTGPSESVADANSADTAVCADEVDKDDATATDAPKNATSAKRKRSSGSGNKGAAARKSRKAYAKYREMSAQLELKQAEQLHELLNGTEQLTGEEQVKIAKYRAEQRAQKQTNRSRAPRTPEQIEAAKAAAQRKKAQHEEFLNSLSPADRELYETEQKLAKSRQATIRKLKRLAADRKILDGLDGDSAVTSGKDDNVAVDKTDDK